jgi:hypothetical protein
LEHDPRIALLASRDVDFMGVGDCMFVICGLDADALTPTSVHEDRVPSDEDEVGDVAFVEGGREASSADHA